jgi:hypothetical protein
MSDQTITSLIEKLEAGPVYLTHKEAYDLAVALGSDVALSLANTIRKAFAGKSLDAALALAERVLPGDLTWRIEKDSTFTAAFWSDPEYEPIGSARSATPALALCAAILRAQSEARV